MRNLICGRSAMKACRLTRSQRRRRIGIQPISSSIAGQFPWQQLLKNWFGVGGPGTPRFEEAPVFRCRIHGSFHKAGAPRLPGLENDIPILFRRGDTLKKTPHPSPLPGVPRRGDRRGASLQIVAMIMVGVGLWLGASKPATAADEVLPKHVNPEALKAVRAGLDYLARTQAEDGAWRDGQGGQAYPVAVSSLACTALLAHGDSPTRGRYAPQLDKGTEFLLKCRTKTGLLTSASQDSGMPMHGHGFCLMYLASVYGVLTKESMRDATHDAVVAGIELTSSSQSGAGGWTYVPGSGDEGSVTVTQVQALRAAHNSGFLVPRGTIDEAVRYIEKCSTPEGGIMYSLGSGGGARLSISAAAVATLYNAGEYDAPVATRCLDYVWGQFQGNDKWNKDGHAFYCQLYASQAFYLSGDEYWDKYYPSVRDQLIAMQDKSDGSWNGDGIGKTYGTAIALIILQLPYRFLPVYQR